MLLINKKSLIISAFLSFAVIMQAQDANLKKMPKEADPKTVGMLVAKRFVASPHNSFRPPAPPNSITYPEVCAWYGALLFAEAAQDKTLLQQLKDRFMPFFGEEKNLIPNPIHVDSNVFGTIPCELYMQTKEKQFLDMGIMFAEKQWTLPVDADQDKKEEFQKLLDKNLSWQTRYWIDDMYMITMAQTQAYRATGERKYIDRAAHEMHVYLDTIQRPNGLFYHSPDAPFFWGRGNGWMAAGMSELLSSLPKDNKDRAAIMNSYLKMMQSLKQFQRPDGLWGQLIDDAASWAETSSSAMFTYAMIIGVKNGWLNTDEYAPLAKKAWIALVKHINADGDIDSVCEGTNRKNDYQYYLDRQRRTGDMHGQAPILWCAAALLSIEAEEMSRWTLAGNGGIEWQISDRIPHDDHIEMSGKQLSVVLRYGVNADSSFTLTRSIVWPMLRFEPNQTHDHLIRRFASNVLDWVLIDKLPARQEKIQKIRLDGVMSVESKLGNNLSLTRTLFPSTTQATYWEQYIFVNTGTRDLRIELPDVDMLYITDANTGVYGAYYYEVKSSGKGVYLLNPGKELTYVIAYSARKVNETAPVLDVAVEFAARRTLVQELWSKLIIETPDPVLNRAFAFAKLRGSESIYATKGGLMHGPGGEAYYAAIWANDQAEYINPFFPYLGYKVGNESAMNSFRHFTRFMNEKYQPIPSSIISEGMGMWNGAGDRGDGAMIAYGAARYALVSGNRAEAEELWPLIQWCLEYCKRKINNKGVVTSDSDELEYRFPSGDANLCTSGLYYDALISAAYLGKDLGKPAKVSDAYKNEAVALKKAIENHFGYIVEGFDTYRYYEGNDILRSWICIPLTMGIFDRSEGTIAALFSPRLWTNDGLLTQAGTQTFWDRSTLYALRGVFAAGAIEKGLDYLEKYSHRRLLGDHVPYAIEAWPEGSQRHLSAESGLYCRIYTEGIFGMRPTGLRSFDLCPRLPDKWNTMSIKACHAFGQVFDIQVVRKGVKLEVTVRNSGGIVIKKNIKPGDTVSVKFK